MTEPLPFIDLAAQQRRIRDAVEAGFARVLDHGRYIMGPEVGALEQRLGAYCGVDQVVSCASGTDALFLALLALGVGRGDAVLVPSYTFTATAEAVALCGATPVFVDVDEVTFNMDPASLEAALDALDGALTPKVVIPVDLFGIVAPYDDINALARARGLTVLADAAQSFGASAGARRVGALADVTATSFFPAKPLGCYGDGGAVFTDDAALAEVMRSIRVHGRGKGKYDNVRVGMNARLDTLQAVVLLEKLTIFDDELARRDRVAMRYSEALGNLVVVPRVPAGTTSAWAQYTIATDRRDEMQAALAAEGIPTQIYYPKPLHQQPPYRACPTAPGGLPVTEALSRRLISLPMHPYLDEEAQARVVDAVRRFVA